MPMPPCLMAATEYPTPHPQNNHTPPTKQTQQDGVFRAYAAVFDGHNGASAAEHAADRLHHVLAAEAAIRTCTGGWVGVWAGVGVWVGVGGMGWFEVTGTHPLVDLQLLPPSPHGCGGASYAARLADTQGRPPQPIGRPAPPACKRATWPDATPPCCQQGRARPPRR